MCKWESPGEDLLVGGSEILLQLRFQFDVIVASTPRLNILSTRTTIDISL
jgi:hypothetical protein